VQVGGGIVEAGLEGQFGPRGELEVAAVAQVGKQLQVEQGLQGTGPVKQVAHFELLKAD
jgi:hypothetical protein